MNSNEEYAQAIGTLVGAIRELSPVHEACGARRETPTREPAGVGAFGFCSTGGTAQRKSVAAGVLRELLSALGAAHAEKVETEAKTETGTGTGTGTEAATEAKTETETARTASAAGEARAAGDDEAAAAAATKPAAQAEGCEATPDGRLESVSSVSDEDDEDDGASAEGAASAVSAARAVMATSAANGKVTTVAEAVKDAANTANAAKTNVNAVKAVRGVKAADKRKRTAVRNADAIKAAVMPWTPEQTEALYIAALACRLGA